MKINVHIMRKLLECLSAYIAGPYRSNSGDKVVFFNLKEPQYFSRYLYNLVMFFHVEGYQIFFPNKHIQFRKLCSTYKHLIIKENIIHFRRPDRDQKYIELNDQNLSPDYFSFLNKKDEDVESYHVPMAMYPGFYHSGLWNKPVTNDSRKKSVFMIGAFNETIYKKVGDNFPGIINRDAIFNFLNKKKILTHFFSRIEFNEFLEGNEDNKCILIKRKIFHIPMNELRFILGKFDFFLACPGTSMAHSHNLIEAMSVGAVPLIQKAYADMLHPPLLHNINAIIFKNLEDLSNKINMVYNLPEEKISKMSDQVKNYYMENLTPESVVKKVEHYAAKTIYLLNLKSIERYREQRAKYK